MRVREGGKGRREREVKHRGRGGEGGRGAEREEGR